MMAWYVLHTSNRFFCWTFVVCFDDECKLEDILILDECMHFLCKNVRNRHVCVCVCVYVYRNKSVFGFSILIFHVISVLIVFVAHSTALTVQQCMSRHMVTLIKSMRATDIKCPEIGCKRLITHSEVSRVL